MGGISQINDRIAIIEGVPHLTGCAVTASDLRAGAALVIAGLMAEGVIRHLQRTIHRPGL